MQPIDLTSDMIPISKVSTQLAHRLRDAKRTGRPLIITCKGYPAAVLLDVASYTALIAAAQKVSNLGNIAANQQPTPNA